MNDFVSNAVSVVGNAFAVIDSNTSRVVMMHFFMVYPWGIWLSIFLTHICTRFMRFPFYLYAAALGLPLVIRYAMRSLSSSGFRRFNRFSGICERVDFSIDLMFLRLIFSAGSSGALV